MDSVRASYLFALILVMVPAAGSASEEPRPEGLRTTSGLQLAAKATTPEPLAIAPDTYCGKDAALGDFCFVDTQCPGAEECTSNADCSAGERCLVESCCGYNVCSPEGGYCSGGAFCGYYQPCTDCQEVVDQNQPSDTTNMATFTQPDLAQSFEQRLPNITSSEIFLRSGNGTQDTIVIEVWDALPDSGGSLVASGGTIARQGEWARVRFTPVALDPGTPYFLVFSSGGSGNLAISGDTSNPYPAGQVFANEGFEPFPSFDYTFRTFAELPIFIDDFESGAATAWGDPFACTIAFDDAWADLGHGSNPDAYYGGFGVHFDNTNGYGVISGEGNGDLGNWNIEGTYGSAAWGLWSGSHAITFDSPVTVVSLDFLRGWSDYSITVNAYLGGTLVGTQTVTLEGAHTSEPVAFAGPLDELVLGTTGVSGAGLDNIVYSGLAGCP